MHIPTYKLSIFQAKIERTQVQGQLDYIVKTYFKQQAKQRVTDNTIDGVIINMVLEAAIYCCKCLTGLLKFTWLSQVYEYSLKKKNTKSLPRWYTHLIAP